MSSVRNIFVSGGLLLSSAPMICVEKNIIVGRKN